MLTAAKDISALVDTFWPLTQDLACSGYPTYADGIKTKADFADQLARASREDWGEVLLFNGGKGLLVIDAVDENYVSLPVCLCGGDQHAFLAETLDYVRAHHPGKTLWFSFAPENAAYQTFADEQGMTLLDDTINWNIREWKSVPLSTDVQRVTAENYAHFRSLWTDETMYWNAERIREKLDKWLLFTTEDAAVACMDEGVMLEIFGFMGNPGDMGKLMEACLNESGGRPLTYFADREESTLMEALGFRRISGYRCYEIKL